MANVSANDRIGIWLETGGDLSKDRTLFRFGKRVESLHIMNGSSSARRFDVQVAREPQFYYPVGISGGHGNRQVITNETYFYVHLAANSTYDSPPFMAERGLKVKSQGTSNCYTNAIVYGVRIGDATYRDPS